MSDIIIFTDVVINNMYHDVRPKYKVMHDMCISVEHLTSYITDLFCSKKGEFNEEDIEKFTKARDAIDEIHTSLYNMIKKS
jgi:hypothetical protein